MYQKRVVNRKIWLVVCLTLCMCLSLIGIAGAAGATSQTDLPTVYSKNGNPSVLNITIHSGDSFQVQLDTAGGTGYLWQMVSPNLKMLSVVSSSKVQLIPNSPGGMERTTFVLQSKPGVSGSESVLFSLRQTWGSPPNVFANVTCNVKITD
jgi:hypothetical protein